MADVSFFVGLHQPHDAAHFDQSCISIRRLWGRKKPINGRVIVDSGAFMELFLHGRYEVSVKEYADELRRLNGGVVNIIAAVAQDYMCEPFMLAKTGMTIDDHQRLTIERYDELMAENLPFPIMPVLQGYAPADYLRHIEMYGDRLKLGMWTGVGSVCKRNGSPDQVTAVLYAIKRARPDLRLHGFGVKLTSLMHGGVRELLDTADSMAWSFAARKRGGDSNDWREAKSFADRINGLEVGSGWQLPMIFT